MCDQDSIGVYFVTFLNSRFDHTGLVYLFNYDESQIEIQCIPDHITFLVLKLSFVSLHSVMC